MGLIKGLTRFANGFYLLIPTVILGFLFYLSVNQDMRYKNDGKKVMGTVTEIRYEDRRARPIIQYTAADGQSYDHDPGAIMFQSLDKGQQVELYYMEGAPNDAYLVKNNERKLTKIVLGCIALLCLAGALSNFFGLSRKKFNVIMTGGVALFFSYMSLFVYQEHRHFIQDAVKATGVIVNKHPQKCNDHGDEDGKVILNDCFAYTVEYITHNNEKLTWRSDREWKERAIGDRMKILYRKNDPSNVRYDVFWDGYGSALVFGILGLVGWFWLLRILRRRYH